MAQQKAERPAERGVRRAETNAVAAYLTALRAPKVPVRSRDALEKRCVQIERWIAGNEMRGDVPGCRRDDRAVPRLLALVRG